MRLFRWRLLLMMVFSGGVGCGPVPSSSPSPAAPPTPSTVPSGPSPAVSGEARDPDSGSAPGRGIATFSDPFRGITHATPGAQGIRVSWEPHTPAAGGTASLRYRLYVAPQSGEQDFSSPFLETRPGVTTVTLTGLAPGRGHHIVVRAVDEQGGEDTNRVERFVATHPLVYVNAASTEPTPDGSSPDHAFRSVEQAITANIAREGANILVAGGRYHGRVVLFDGMTIIGGFDESFDPLARDPVRHATILEADAPTDLVIVAPGDRPSGLVGLVLRGNGVVERGVVADDCEIYIEDCEFTGFVRKAIHLRGSKTDESRVEGRITACQVMDNAAEGLVLEGCLDLRVRDCTFLRNGNEGIEASRLRASSRKKIRLSIDGCAIRENRDIGIDIDIDVPLGSAPLVARYRIAIRDCEITGNLDHGISVDVLGAVDRARDLRVHIEGNVISGNGKSGVHLAGDESGDFRIACNRIAGNRGQAAVLLTGSAPESLYRVLHNDIEGNEGDGVRLEGAGSLVVRYCTVKANGGAAVVSRTGWASLGGSILSGNGAASRVHRATYSLLDGDRLDSTLDSTAALASLDEIRVALLSGSPGSTADLGDHLEQDLDGSRADLGFAGGPSARPPCDLNMRWPRRRFVELIEILPPPGSFTSAGEWKLRFNTDLESQPRVRVSVVGEEGYRKIRLHRQGRTLTLTLERRPEPGRVFIVELLPWGDGSRDGGSGRDGQPWHLSFDYLGSSQ